MRSANKQLGALRRIICEAMDGHNEISVPMDVNITVKVPLRCEVDQHGRIASVSHFNFEQLKSMIAAGTAKINQATWPNFKEVELEHQYLQGGGRRFS